MSVITQDYTELIEGNTRSLNDLTNNSRARNWCFTLNNWTESEYNSIIMHFTQKHSTKYVVGKEIAPTTNTPHLQGYVSFKDTRTFSVMKRMMPRANIRKARGTALENLGYCSKYGEGDWVTNIIEEVAVVDLINNHNKNIYKDIVWRPWQQRIIDLTKTIPNSRTVTWVVDSIGNSGKSFLARYMHWSAKTIIVSGKATDIFNGILTWIKEKKTLPEIVIVDCPRSNEKYVSYQAIEKIKDGLLYSGKYEGGVVELLPCHVIVFSNFPPQLNKMSADRWNVISLDDEAPPVAPISQTL